MTTAADKIIVALDVPSEKEALALVNDLHSRSRDVQGRLAIVYRWPARDLLVEYRFSHEFFSTLSSMTSQTPSRKQSNRPGPVACEMLTIHLSGGAEMIRAATAVQRQNFDPRSDGPNELRTNKRYGKSGISEGIERARARDWQDWASKTESTELSPARMKSKRCAQNSVIESRLLFLEFDRPGLPPAIRSDS